MQVVGGFPEVFQDVDEVEDQVDPHAAGVGFGVDPVDLVVVAVDQHDPAAQVVRVALLGPVEQSGGHRGGGIDDRRVDLTVDGFRPGPAGGAFGGAGGHDVGGAADRGCGVIDGGDHGHAGPAGAFTAGQLGRRRLRPVVTDR
ncbi:hypothetical protein [Actinoplanes derwentensis]|uniref:hypothetical protein n=1 Tax=Actinoplanes derwentensis TaxID=113562 RepID=UPI0012FE2526|nr:hypothetical protein [Actinoplanes derwentensis]